MKNKAFKIAAVTLLGVLTLAGCSSSKEVASMKGAKITEQDLYNELKKDTNTTGQVLTGMILNNITDKEYGSKVDTKEIDKQYNDMQEQNGGKKAFEDLLKQNGLTTKTYKESIKSQLAFKEMLKAHMEIKEDDLKETWATYHPSVDTQIIKLDSADAANAALKEIKDGKSFDDVAKDKSLDETTKADGGKVTFDSTYTTKPEHVSIPDTVKEAAYKLEDGAVSEVLTATDMTTGAESYYIVKMIKNQKKGNDYKKFEKELTKLTEEAKLADPTFQQEVIGKELEKANVKIADKDFKDILTPYLPQKEVKTEESSKADKKDDKKDEKKEETDSTK